MYCKLKPFNSNTICEIGCNNVKQFEINFVNYTDKGIFKDKIKTQILTKTYNINIRFWGE